MYLKLAPYLVGAFLAMFMAYSARFMPYREERRYWTALAILMIFAFPPFPISAGDLSGFWYELTVGGVVATLLLLSRYSFLMLGIVYFVHGVWDLVHILEIVPVDKPLWISEFCVPYDWIIAGYIVFRWRKMPKNDIDSS